jgi:hypothetical protein
MLGTVIYLFGLNAMPCMNNMKLDFTLDNEDYYINNEDLKLCLCGHGIRKIFKIRAKRIKLDLRRENPKKKGFKKVSFNGINLLVDGETFGLTIGTVNFLHDNGLLNYFWVKCGKSN